VGLDEGMHKVNPWWKAGDKCVKGKSWPNCRTLLTFLENLRDLNMICAFNEEVQGFVSKGSGWEIEHGMDKISGDSSLQLPKLMPHGEWKSGDTSHQLPKFMPHGQLESENALEKGAHASRETLETSPSLTSMSKRQSDAENAQHALEESAFKEA
jgi:hypothetical protein